MSKPRMIRGVIKVPDRYGSGAAVATTFWYRHDEDLTELRQSMDELLSVFRKSYKSSIATIAYEHKEYEAE